jgi:hypothetical protein
LKKLSFSYWKLPCGTTLEKSAISFLEDVWRDNHGKIRNLLPGSCLAGQAWKIRNLLPGSCLAGQPWKIPQSLTWKLSGGTTLEKYSKRDLSDSSREVLA